VNPPVCARASALLLLVVVACAGAHEESSTKGLVEPPEPPLSAAAAAEPPPKPKPVEPPSEPTVVAHQRRTLSSEETLTLASARASRCRWLGHRHQHAVLAARVARARHPPRVGDVAATTADEAVAKVWVAFDPTFTRPCGLRSLGRRAALDERKTYAYEVAPNEKRS